MRGQAFKPSYYTVALLWSLLVSTLACWWPRDYADRLEKDSGEATRRVAVQDSGLTAIFDGKRFVFNESAWTAVNLFNVVRRYGLSYFWLRSAPRSMLRNYLRLYELQARPKTLNLQAHHLLSGALLEQTMTELAHVLSRLLWIWMREG